MRKLLFILLFLAIPAAYADETAHLKINISGSTPDNRYFLCLPDVGCLSIDVAAKGKVYQFYNPIPVESIYLLDTANAYRVYPEGLPASCKVTAQPNQTVTISGHIVKNAHSQVRLEGLHCSVSA
jgi:hypothetical protein